MTLIIAGHDLEEGIDFRLAWGTDDDDTGNLPQPKNMRSNGLFVAADSVITVHDSSGATPIIGGFRKIYPISIKVFKPYFLGLYFHSYREIIFESECFIAMAGSTLTAQHVLNLISEHLSKIRVSYEKPTSYGEKGKYLIIRHCQKNILDDGQGSNTWSEDMFTPNDYNEIITADAIAEIMEYSINEALSSARKYKLDPAALRNMYTEFAAGIHCPTTNEHKLYTFRMKSRLNTDGIIEVFVERRDIPETEVAVLGMRSEFEARAQIVFNKAIATGTPPAKEIFRFVNEAIDETRSAGSSAIDRPSLLKMFNRGQLTKAALQR